MAIQKLQYKHKCGDSWLTASFESNTTGSFNENAGGGTWYTSSAASQSFSGVQTDVRMDVTDIVKGWLSGSRPNDGFMIKRADADESSNEEHGRISFFSKDTNTIFPPKLESHGMTQVSNQFIRVRSRR